MIPSNQNVLETSYKLLEQVLRESLVGGKSFLPLYLRVVACSDRWRGGSVARLISENFYRVIIDQTVDC